MELDSIVKQLNKKFSEPLPEFFKRRVIFWNDEDGDFKEDIEGLKLENAKVIVLKDNNNFAVKRLLTSEDLDNNYLVYNPFATDMEDDWLLDIKLFSDDFRADQLSMWMQEMNIAPIPVVRDQLKEYKQYLNAASRRKVLAQFGSEITNVHRLHMAILASILKTRMNPKEIVKSVMKNGDDLQNKATLQKTNLVQPVLLLTLNSKRISIVSMSAKSITKSSLSFPMPCAMKWRQPWLISSESRQKLTLISAVFKQSSQLSRSLEWLRFYHIRILAWRRNPAHYAFLQMESLLNQAIETLF